MGSIYQPSPIILPQTNASLWTPDPLWPDMEALLSQYAGSYASRMGCIVSEGSSQQILTGAAAYRTSDRPSVLNTTGGTYTWTGTDSVDSRGRKFRWIIYYYNSVNVSFSTTAMIPPNSRYVVFDGCNITDLWLNTNIQTACKILESFDFINNANTSQMTDWTAFVQYFYSLLRIPDSLDTSNGVIFASFGRGTDSLTCLPDNFDTSKGTNFDFFLYASGIQYLPENLNTSQGISFSSFCTQARKLRYLSKKLDTSKWVRESGANFCNTCPVLCGYPDGIDWSGLATSPMGSNLYSLSTGWISGLKFSVAWDDASFPMLSTEFILNTMRDAQVVAGQTFTLGASNYAKVASYTAEIAAFQAKGWTLGQI